MIELSEFFDLEWFINYSDKRLKRQPDEWGVASDGFGREKVAIDADLCK